MMPMAPREGDTCDARCHSHKMHVSRLLRRRTCGGWGCDSPPTGQSFDKKKKKEKPKKERETGAVRGGKAAINQFGGGVVAGSVHGRKKIKKEKKGK